MPKKTERRNPLGFFSIHSVAKHQKLRGGPFQKKIVSKKVSQCGKKLKAFSVSRYCMLRGKEEKPFWFSSLRQMIQFRTIKFRRTFKNCFGQFVWIEKKLKSHFIKITTHRNA